MKVEAVNSVCSGSGSAASVHRENVFFVSCFLFYRFCCQIWIPHCCSLLQIDGSTLRTICMQHGPLLTFHLGLTQGTALIRYGSKQEASKARSALHM